MFKRHQPYHESDHVLSLIYHVATGEPLDKAGGYGLQGGGADFVVDLLGGRDNVIGLPVTTVLELLATVGPADDGWRRLPGG